MMSIRKSLIAVSVTFLILGCATAPPGDDPEALAEYDLVNDPLEPMNRTIFAFNQGLDRVIVRPAALAYREALPSWFRVRIGSALDNMRAPVIFFNDLLQGDVNRALTTLVRFGINSTFGVGGLNDLASDLGLEEHNEDFGQTLAVWGSEPGPYLMLPVLGPSNPRDSIGRVVDFLVDPVNAWARNTDRDAVPISRAVAAAVHTRAEFLDVTDDLEKTSLDLYAAFRSLYRQRRANAIANGDGAGAEGVPSAGAFPGFTVDPVEEQLSSNP